MCLLTYAFILIFILAVPITSTSSGTTVNLGSLLKPSDKITVPSGIAQLVQTSTGKHILFTPTSTINTSNIGISGSTTGSSIYLTVLYLYLYFLFSF